MSDEEIASIQHQIQQFKLPVGTTQLITELQRRLEVIQSKSKREILAPAPIPEPAVPSITEAPGADWQGIASQIKSYFEELSGQMGEQLALLTGPPDEPQPSLHYERIGNMRVRRQLVADNTRMEGALRKIEFLPDFHEEQAFRRFCTFAAFQVEEMLNYFYFNRYGDDIPTLIADFKQLRVEVKGFGDEKRSIKSIDKILTFVKIKAYNQEFYGKDLSLYNTLANIRNMEEHRCSVLLKSNESLLSHETYALQMIRERNPSSVRDYLERMYQNITK